MKDTDIYSDMELTEEQVALYLEDVNLFWETYEYIPSSGINVSIPPYLRLFNDGTQSLVLQNT